MLKTAVIGYGYWGPNLVRNFMENSHTDVGYVSDLSENRLNLVKNKYNSIKTTTEYKDILRDPDIQLVSIATPVSTHYNLAKEVLLSGKNVLIEKPMTSTVKEAEELINLAHQKDLTIFVDHTYLFTGSVNYIKGLVQSGALGDIYYFDSVRVNLGLYQHDINVMWDLAPHDFAIMDYIIDEKPVSVTANGGKRVFNHIEDICYINVKFESGFIANFHVNWLSPVKIRKIIIGGSKKMIVFDDLDPDEKIKIYDRGVTLIEGPLDKIYKELIQYRIGDVYIPMVDKTEALKAEVDNIVDCLKNKKQPKSDSHRGLNIVRLLEGSHKSLEKGGSPVAL